MAGRTPKQELYHLQLWLGKTLRKVLCMLSDAEHETYEETAVVLYT